MIKDDKTTRILKAIGGVLLIDVQGEPKLCAMEDMKNSKFFDIGSLFNAIRVLNGKEISDYGNLWPSYRNTEGDISNEWKMIKEVHSKADSDWDFVLEVCNQLQEEVPVVLEKKEVLKGLDDFKNGILTY